MPTTEEYLNSLKRDKQNIINSIKAKGTDVPDNATFTDLVSKVDSIETGINTSDATVTTNDIKLGKTAYAKDTKLTGTLTFDTFGSDYDNCLNAAKQIEGSIPLENPYFVNNITGINSITDIRSLITSIPLLDTSKVTNMNHMFDRCTNLTEVPLLNTINVINMSNMFDGCKRLTTIPLLDTSKVTSMNNTFSFCSSLSDESLNNILQMCINAVAYTGKKVLQDIGLDLKQIDKCKTLPNWQAFLDAGWTSRY